MAKANCDSGIPYAGRLLKVTYIILSMQIILVTSMAEDFYNPDYEESDHENLSLKLTLPNQADITGNPQTLQQNDNDNLESDKTVLRMDEITKRHLAALAALSGLKSRDKSDFMLSQMEKKHMGSIAALSKPGSTKQFPTVKRHLGSISSKSGARNPISAVGLRSDGEFDKRHLGAVARANSNPFSRVLKSDVGMEEGFPSDENNDERFLDYPALTPKISETAYLPPSPYEIQLRRSSLIDEPGSFKSKRFLGSLARVGWFPRPFRGIVADNPYEKRHIGSAARVGWVPFSKADRYDDDLGDGGFKRNAGEVRRVQFIVPNHWGRFRTTRMLV